MMRIFLLFLLLPLLSFSQTVNRSHAGAIKLKLKRLNFLGSVLYVAAHPDDENTRIITAMANEKLAATAYLSMTRGDGGQNLIGAEMRDMLGLIRTQELLAARRIDGGEQFFTRAIDFGYSKSADETVEFWGKDSVLHDVVKVFRQFQPDVIITRFPPDERAGHGHHTASAMLAIEAFEKAAKSDVFPDQLKTLTPWQPSRLYTNTGRWWNTSINENTPGIIAIDVGGFSPLLGESYSEIAAISRSQHKSQGFGSRGTRGRQLEFLEYQIGARAEKDLFEGVNTSWSRIKGGEPIQKQVNELIRNYQEEDPAASIPMLLQLRKSILALEPSVWRNRKLQETEQLIQDCAGLYLGATADEYWVAPGEYVQINFELLNRSAHDISIDRIAIKGTDFDSTTNISLKREIPVLFHSTRVIKNGSAYSDPYWLKEPHGTGLFRVDDYHLIGKPENDPAVSITFSVTFGSETIVLTKPLVYKWTDPVKGELSRPFETVPPVFINLYEDVMIFRDQQPKTVRLLVKSASRKPLSGTLSLNLPKGWRTEPLTIPINMQKSGEEQTHVFKVFPSAEEITATLRAEVSVGSERYDQSIKVINYDHIPVQTLLPPATAKIVRVNLKETGGSIGYLKGAGDDVPAALRNMGYDVRELNNGDVTPENLNNLDAVVLGIRALNTNERIPFVMTHLLDYVKAGGTLVIQYNTAFSLQTDFFSPFPLHISRDRVSQEDAEVSIINPGHRVLNYPNKITTADFNEWVQERGLYFPDTWDNAFEPVLSMHDSGEDPKEGALLVAPYGDGFYVYTGLSFFRQLPEGVAGAYKLFANIVSLSKTDTSSESPTEIKARNKKKKS